jgi:hypothetical protein
MNDPTSKLLSTLRAGEAGQPEEVFPPEFQRDLLAAITQEAPFQPHGTTAPRARRRLLGASTSRSSRRRPRMLGALGALGATTAVAAGVVVLATSSAVGPAPADAVSFHRSSSGDIIATVTDPFATRARLDAAFAKQGLHITIDLIPASPSAVGRVVYLAVSSSRGAHIESLTHGSCVSNARADCLVGLGGPEVIGLRIPRDFTAKATIGLGRPAKPGERYESGGSAFAAGELLHCSGLLGTTVAQALPVFERDKLTTRWNEDIEVRNGSSGVSSRSRSVSRPPAGDYIWGAELAWAGHLMVQVERTPWPDTPGAGSSLNDGC